MRPNTDNPPVLDRRRRLAALCLTCVLGLLLGVVIPTRNATATSSVGFQLIAHPATPYGAVKRDWVARAFLKRTLRWPNGEAVRPVDQRRGAAVRSAFSETVVRRSVNAIHHYWLQRIFAGRETPPPELESDAEVIRFVTQTPGAIGYVLRDVAVAGPRTLTIQ